MKVDAPAAAALAGIGERARHLEQLGYDGLRVAELNHDPFMPLAVAAEHTERIELVTSVAVAFARNTMSMAVLAQDEGLSGVRLKDDWTDTVVPCGGWQRDSRASRPAAPRRRSRTRRWWRC